MSLELSEERPIAATHQVAAASDGATDLIAKMAALMRLILFDTRSPEQAYGDLLMGCPCK
ncbi:hypothetical protein [Mesorhizobium sp. WSM2239]|uniref:Uncharacterized protein n=2 Tax=unclassified Mesorhizobium TaxID=325217 RepID=A0AAU8D970_9HYPH